MSDAPFRLESLGEREVLLRITQWESARDVFIQLLRENPQMARFQDARTLENLGLKPPQGW